MKYVGFILSLFTALALVMALSLDLGGMPAISDLLDPFRGFWQNQYSEDHRPKDVLKMNGLREEVTVRYDENLIPHIFAKNELDLYRAQGYVTAKHRLWQMEFQIMAAAGRISEVVGAQALDFDRLQRRKGLSFGAEAGLRFLEETDPESLEKLHAYADGVNEFIHQTPFAKLPIEYKLLGYQPSEWNAGKTLLLLKYMADMLVGDSDVEYTNLRLMLGETWMNRLFPDFPDVVDPVIDQSQRWTFSGSMPEVPEGIVYPDSLLWMKTMGKPEPGTGSNNWAVSGSKTLNGNPILANDPHLSLNMPSLWYAIQLSTPEFSAKGASLPGALGVISGFNENIAWGVTNATRDVRDLYFITFKDDTRMEYLYNDQWMPASLRIETIKVKGEPDFLDSVVYTHHGPVVYDNRFYGEKQQANFALKWTAHEGSNEQKTFLLLNKAKDHSDYINALNHFTSPAQNFVFASRDGDIAMKVQGRFPIKWREQGKYLMDGSDPRFDWSGYIPFEENPASINPPRGFVSSANQHSTDSTYPYYLFDHTFENYRNRRINGQLAKMNGITVDDMKALQFDSYHLHASEILPVLLAYVSDSSATANRDLEVANRDLQILADWDYFTQPNTVAPTLFTLWWDTLKEAVFSKWQLDNLPIVLPNDYQLSKLILEDPESELFDLPETVQVETAVDLAQISFLKAVETLRDLESERGAITWAAYKRTSINHLVPNFTSFGYQGIETGGGKGIVNATDSRHGASWRMVVELDDSIKAFGIYPGGQSGNPGSRYYGNFISKWAVGEYVNFGLRSLTDTDDILFETRFEPTH
ncbi:MAG: penicillin acylase family protein [Lunatimonas sp.]|uniref:penicillin acylase family protein n=1 Tax=Lunatimonas sp. TaxID=2060141 RepID=UPI00263B8545|nr:penicillin acylase family protein [Lunatimonas sp.]MCC5938758.1 penicillin acylase family protein [Lunatimonas sp.]